MKDIHAKTTSELHEEKEKRWEEIINLRKSGFDRRQIELLERLTGNIAKIEAEIKRREEEL